MAKRILQKMQEKIRKRLYVMTLHAEEEMDSDSLTVFDVERVILTGEIIEQQRDRKTGERKYVVRGETLERGQAAVVVNKFGATDKLVILTVYVE